MRQFWEARHAWWTGCVERAMRHPVGSFEHLFWWSLRYELHDPASIATWARRPAEAIEDWAQYWGYKARTCLDAKAVTMKNDTESQKV